jgi:hypothetical protein
MQKISGRPIIVGVPIRTTVSSIVYVPEMEVGVDSMIGAIAVESII